MWYLRRLVKSLFAAFGYRVGRIQVHRFTVAGVRYETDPCSVGLTSEGELTANGAVRMIRARGLRDLRILDIACGVGIVGLTLQAKLPNSGVLREVAFADINFFNLNSLRRTLRFNQITAPSGAPIQVWLSDCLDGVPAAEKFDIIVSNPPHYVSSEDTEAVLSAGELGTYDAGWAFHKSFYTGCHEHLTDTGEVWFLECKRAATVGDLLPFVETNPKLEFVEEVTEPNDPDFFWMVTKLRV